MEKLFSIPSSKKTGENVEKPHMIWAHKYRGFGDGEDVNDKTDLFHFPLGLLIDYKQEVGDCCSLLETKKSNIW